MDLTANVCSPPVPTSTILSILLTGFVLPKDEGDDLPALYTIKDSTTAIKDRMAEEQKGLPRAVKTFINYGILSVSIPCEQRRIAEYLEGSILFIKSLRLQQSPSSYCKCGWWSFIDSSTHSLVDGFCKPTLIYTQR